MATEINDHPAIGPTHQLPANVPKRRRRHGVVWVPCLGLLLLVCISCFRAGFTAPRRSRERSGGFAARPAPGIAVTSATAQKGSIGVYLDAIGTVTPVYTDSITSQVNGLVLAVQFQEGQRVHKGDPLIDIDSRPYRATLLQAQGTLERDENLLAQAQMDRRTLPVKRGPATPLQNRYWTTRKSWRCKTRAP